MYFTCKYSVYSLLYLEEWLCVSLYSMQAKSDTFKKVLQVTQSFNIYLLNFKELIVFDDLQLFGSCSRDGKLFENTMYLLQKLTL